MATTSWTKDTVVVVTGGNKGIGYEIVKGFAKAGLTVVLTARDEGRGLAALKTLQGEGLDTIHFHQLAVDDDESVKKLASSLKSQFGGIDILVNNAAVAIGGISYENVYKSLDTNYWGVPRVTQGLMPLFKPYGLGRVVVVSSRVGQLEKVPNESLRKQLAEVSTVEEVESLAQRFLEDAKTGNIDDWSDVPHQYPVTKVLLNARIRVVHNSLASRGILVNCICPGFVRTDLNNNNPNAKLTTVEGADTPVWLALLPKDNYPHGKFFAERTEIAY